MKAKVHRTWPCGMQESLELRTNPFLENAKATDESIPRPCPLHGVDCRRETRPPVM